MITIEIKKSFDNYNDNCCYIKKWRGREREREIGDGGKELIEYHVIAQLRR